MKNIINTALLTTLIAYTIYAIVVNTMFSKQVQCELLKEQGQQFLYERKYCGLQQ